MLKFISAEDLNRLFTFETLTDALRDAFAEGANAPLRHRHIIERPEGTDAALLLMPAWSKDAASGHIGVKIVTVTPDNGELSLPAVMASFILMDGKTGAPSAIIDGAGLTVWRTSCASALAARYLAPKNAKTLLVVGAGELAPYLARAHAAVRDFERIMVWNRRPASAETLASALKDDGYPAEPVADLDSAVPDADVITAATLSREPLIKGALVTPGTHIDLVGAFMPQMRESDDDCVKKASVFVDTFEGATKEGGDIVQPIEAGVLSMDDIRADLHALSTDAHPGRQSDEEITLFKSTGAALEDLAAAVLAERLSA